MSDSRSAPKRRAYSARCPRGRGSWLTLRMSREEYERAYERAAVDAKRAGEQHVNLSRWARERLLGGGA